MRQHNLDYAPRHAVRRKSDVGVSGGSYGDSKRVKLLSEISIGCVQAFTRDE